VGVKNNKRNIIHLLTKSGDHGLKTIDDGQFFYFVVLVLGLNILILIQL
jgi:hypothetical protein